MAKPLVLVWHMHKLLADKAMTTGPLGLQIQLQMLFNSLVMQVVATVRIHLLALTLLAPLKPMEEGGFSYMVLQARPQVMITA